MPAHAVPIDIKEQGVTWLLPPYSWSIRHIARKLDLSPSVIARWRLELVQHYLKWNWLIIVGEWGYLLSKLKNGELYPFRLMK